MPQLLGPSTRSFRWFNWTQRWSQGQDAEEAEPFADAWAEPVELEVAPLPAQPPHTRPARLKRSRRTLAHATLRELMDELRARYRAFREASARSRAGNSVSAARPPSFASEGASARGEAWKTRRRGQKEWRTGLPA